jgi:hypothetical protein
MRLPDLENYYKRKHQLESLINELYKDEKTAPLARNANSQLQSLESFISQQLDSFINHAILQVYNIEQTILSAINSDTE